MSEQENGQLPLAKQPVRSRLSSERWEQVKTAHTSGIGLREIARNMGIPEGTVLARARKARRMVTASQQCQSPRSARRRGKGNRSI